MVSGGKNEPAAVWWTNDEANSVSSNNIGFVVGTALLPNSRKANTEYLVLIVCNPVETGVGAGWDRTAKKNYSYIYLGVLALAALPGIASFWIPVHQDIGKLLGKFGITYMSTGLPRFTMAIVNLNKLICHIVQRNSLQRNSLPNRIANSKCHPFHLPPGSSRQASRFFF